MSTRFHTRLALIGALVTVSAPVAHAQRALTTADYDRAVKMLSFNVNPLVTGGTVNVTWLPDDRFYYRDVTPNGAEWVLVNPAKRTRAPLYNASAVAAALGRAGAGTF